MKVTNKIKKVTLNKNRVLKVEFIETIINDKNEERENTSSTTYGHLVHKDLVIAMDALKPHLAMLCEQTENAILRPTFDQLPLEKIAEIVEKYHIASFTLGKNGEGVSIGGAKMLNSNEMLVLDSPHQDYDERYEWSPDLSMTMDIILQEVQLYMDGKEADAVQGDLFKGNGDDME